MKLFILYYSMFGHVHKMAEALAEGARQVPGTNTNLARVPETLPEIVLENMGALEAQGKYVAGIASKLVQKKFKKKIRLANLILHNRVFMLPTGLFIKTIQKQGKIHCLLHTLFV